MGEESAQDTVSTEPGGLVGHSERRTASVLSFHIGPTDRPGSMQWTVQGGAALTDSDRQQQDWLHGVASGAAVGTGHWGAVPPLAEPVVLPPPHLVGAREVPWAVESRRRVRRLLSVVPGISPEELGAARDLVVAAVPSASHWQIHTQMEEFLRTQVMQVVGSSFRMGRRPRAGLLLSLLFFGREPWASRCLRLRWWLWWLVRGWQQPWALAVFFIVGMLLQWYGHLLVGRSYRTRCCVSGGWQCRSLGPFLVGLV